MATPLRVALISGEDRPRARAILQTISARDIDTDKGLCQAFSLLIN
jgi:hypothetical protein